MTLPPWIPPALADWLPTLGAAVIALALAELVFRVGERLLRRAVRHAPFAGTVLTAVRGPARALLPLLLLNPVWQEAPPTLAGLSGVQRVTGLLLIAVLTWLLARAVQGSARAVIEAHPVTVADNLEARRIHTQARVLSRVVLGLVVLVGVSLMLMSFPAVRQVGTSLLASAGVVGIVAGFAARPVLGNLIAGLQIGLSQPIRIDDVVIVENEWGVIEEITGTYVVVRIWDQRRLVVPLQYWIEKPFQNWTRRTSELIGTVFLWVDYRMPLAPLREALQRAVEASPHWDKRFALLQVTEAGSDAMQLRCLVTAASASAAWDLRCHVRETLIDFVQREYPQYLPRLRAETTLEPAPGTPVEGLATAPAAGAAPAPAAG
ncbi:mechanosensitive ion channel family protein [Piscinibacter sakaiensis]|uniref:Small-conductance mechanosensitive channel n=1 Tax=Piscinibacter sakaiensis TaxID=1547922 RepID=A0A0K8NZJ9_PISS1|nr:mechanosensitive ion channel domain-containing protein [Piscinibacter sakaiensis]GAP35355.1 small-conductance mechanosensitive channel [Piscinibacter sakaiensis]